MAKTAVARSADLEPIDRLEEKLKLLVSMITQLKAEQAKAAAENGRLAQQLDELRARLSDAENTNAELGALREERELIRTRVADMLQQLEGI
jgi:regulator of replication initiation timing